MKTVIFSSNVKFGIYRSLRTFSMLAICFRKFSSISVFLLYKKLIPKILTVFNLKSVYFILQKASLSPFSAPIPAHSHLDLLGFKSEKDENVSKALITSIKDSLSFRKNVAVVWSAYAVYKNVWLNILRPFFVFVFLNRHFFP